MTDKMTDKMISIYNINQISNEKVELYEEEGKYFLRIDFDYEDQYAYYKGHIERIVFDVKLHSITIKKDLCSSYMAADLGLEEDLAILPDKDGHYYTLTFVKEKIHEMTIEEIEKKLGHKVKVVAKSS